MASQRFLNNTSAPILEFLRVGDTTITVGNDDGRIPPLEDGDWYVGTIVPAGGSAAPEIVKITAVNGNEITVEREQEGTSSQDYIYGATLQFRITASALNAIGETLGQIDEIYELVEQLPTEVKAEIYADLGNTTDPDLGDALIGTRLEIPGMSGNPYTQHELNQFRIYADQLEGVATDGTDCSAAMNTALPLLAAAGYREVVFRDADYVMADVLVPAGMRLVGSTYTRILKPVGSGTSSYIFKFDGSLGDSTPLTANNTGTSVTVEDGSLFAIGDYVVLQDDSYISGDQGRNREIKRVIDVSGNTITFNEVPFGTYTTANNAELVQLNPCINSGLHNMTLIGLNANNTGGLVVSRYGVDLEFTKVNTQYPSSQPGFRFDICYNILVQNCSVTDGVNRTTADRGYGVMFNEGTAYGKCYDTYFENIRESMFTNRARYCKFSRCEAVNNSDSGFNSHGSGCSFCDIEDNVIRGGQNQGISVGYTTHTMADDRISVRRNRISCTGNTSAIGLYCRAPSDKKNTNIIFEGNEVNGTFLYGMIVSDCTGFRSNGNFINGSSAAQYGAAFYTSANIELRNDTVQNIGNGVGFYIEGVNTMRGTDLISRYTSGNCLTASTSSGVNSSCWMEFAYRDADCTLTQGVGFAGRREAGFGTASFSSQSSMSIPITFQMPFRSTPSITVTCTSQLGNFRANFNNQTTDGFSVVITDIGGTARTGSVPYSWSAQEVA